MLVQPLLIISTTRIHHLRPSCSWKPAKHAQALPRGTVGLYKSVSDEWLIEVSVKAAT